jgi:general secretion pathway protein G
MSERELVENAQLLWEKERRLLNSHHSPLTTHHLRHVLRNARGFTFIEIMVVVAILAILAALVIPRIMGRTDDAKRTAAKVQIRNIEGALQLYKLDNGVYPTTEQGLKALVEKPTVGVIPKKWKIGGYLQKLPEDPWQNPYKYASPSQKRTPAGLPLGEYEIMSLATDGEVGGEGINADISNLNLDKD